MKTFFRPLLSFLLLGAVFGLVACSSGGDSPAPQAVAIDDSNAEALGIAATDAAYQASVVNDANPFAVSTVPPDDLTVTVSRIIGDKYRPRIAVSGEILMYGDCGGDIDVPNPNATSGTMTFNDFCVSVPGYGDMVMDGTVTYSFRDPLLSLTYNNMSVSFGGETQTLNMSVTVNLDTFEVVSSSSSFPGSDGSTLTISNFDISGTPSSGVYINSGRVTHPSFGYFDISTTSPVVLTGCTNDRPMSGTIVAQGSNGTSASITFNGCNDYTWCYDLGDGSGPQCSSGTW